MAAITAALIKQVREETGAGMMDVKKALTEAEDILFNNLLTPPWPDGRSSARNRE